MPLNFTGRFLVIVAFICLAAPAVAQALIPSKVDIAWNRMYDYGEVTQLLHELAAAYPDLLTLESLGQSVQGRDIWLVTLNNPDTGPDTTKPAMYIDGNIHGNEVQSTEVVLYSIWYLTKSYGNVEPLTELIDRSAFYFVPIVNPDSRAHWFSEPNTPHSQRGGQKPVDSDRDGLLDEDGPDDLDGDGHIGRMWRFDPHGTHRRNRDDPRIIERVEEGQTGDLSFAGWEGIDNDGDGDVNEDGPGGYDMNRNWPSGWTPDHIQRGAGEHPLSYPETRCIAEFILSRPNIAAGQSYHNTGGMILRGPGTADRESFYPRADVRIYDRLGEVGEQLLPFYNYMIIHADLYPVHGGSVNWLAEGLGVITFTNELWTGRQKTGDTESRSWFGRDERLEWNDRMLFGQAFTDWTEHRHPTYGRVLIGGPNKWSSRTPPSFMLEEECHRNFAFTVYHAQQMPRLTWSWTDVERLRDGLWRLTAEVKNENIIPTRTAVAQQHGIGTPDRAIISSEDGVEVIASGTVSARHERSMDAVEHRPHRLLNDAGVPGESARLFRFIVTGEPGDVVTLRYEAEKARDIETTVMLEES